MEVSQDQGLGRVRDVQVVADDALALDLEPLDVVLVGGCQEAARQRRQATLLDLVCVDELKQLLQRVRLQVGDLNLEVIRGIFNIL